ncbi:MAG: VWA domain-containing protein, partial [Clostridia bacterium]|nr:VWA domain-containing protein [Clostridia bacterium]
MKKSYRARKLMMLVMALMMLCSLFGMSAAEENVTPLLVPDAVVSTDGNITLNKWAERIGPDEWKVTVTADVKAIEVEPPKLEVVFVLDTSLSMKECADEEEHKNIGTWQYHTHDDSCPDGCDKYMIQHRKNNSCHYWTSSYADVQITPNRLTVATQAAEQLISSLPKGTAVSRVSFASRAFVEPTFTSGIYAAGETYLMSGVDLALQQFSNSEKTKILVIVTDGAATDNRYSSTALSAFTGAGGMVFTVGFNHEDANLAGMVANGGAYYHAGNPGELTSAFNQIGKKISTMVVDPMGSTVNFDITGVETNNNLSHSGNTIYWRPTEGQNMVGRVVEYSYNVKLNDSADRSEGTHLDVPLNGTTTFRYGITTGTGENATTQMNKLNFPIPEATYAYSSVQVRWVDEEGKDMSQYGFSPTEAEKMISDYSSDTYQPEFKTDYTNITERIDIPDGDGVYYQYVGTEYKADEQLLSSVDGVDATKAAAYTVVHQYQKVVPGNLEIIKALPNANDTMLADRFTFSITGPETFAGTVSYTLNKEPMTGTVDEKNTLTIEGVKADDVIQLQYIPSGDYTVTETGADGNKLFYNVTYPEG